MFKIFTGFHLVESYHRAKREKRGSESHVLKKLILALITLAVTLIVWNLPTESFGINNLTVVQQRIIAIFGNRNDAAYHVEQRVQVLPFG